MIKITNYRLIKKCLISKSIIPLFITSEGVNAVVSQRFQN